MCSQLLILLTLNKNGFPFGSLKFQRSTYTYVQVYSFHALQQQFSLNPNVQQYIEPSAVLLLYRGTQTQTKIEKYTSHTKGRKFSGETAVIYIVWKLLNQ